MGVAQSGRVSETTIPIFLNPRAGSAVDADAASLQSVFREAGARIEIHPIVPARLADDVQAAIASGASVIGAGGGDGTISTVANIVAGTEAALLPLPLGTLNHFAKRYGITDVAAAAQAVARGNIEAVHVGRVNGRVFVNNASCGFYPHVVRHRERMEVVLPRIPAMWLAGARVLLELPLMHLQLEANGMRQDIRTPALWVGIGRNSLRLPVPGDAETEGSVLEAVSGRASTRRAVVRTAFRLLRHLRNGLSPEAAGLDVVRSRAFMVASRRDAIDIALDGEPFRLRGPLDFELWPGALKVLTLV